MFEISLANLNNYTKEEKNMAINIGHASLDENGKISGGAAGDQNGKEVCIRTWYSKPWSLVLRSRDSAKAEKMAKACEAGCANNKIGYDQGQRNTLNTQASKVGYDLGKITTACECDCSSFMAVCAQAAGYNIPYSGGNAPTTSTLQSAFVSTGGFDVLTASQYLTTDVNLKRGDVLVKPGSHTAMALGNGANIVVVPSDPDGEIKTGGTMQATTNQTGQVLLSVHMRDIGWGAWIADGNMAGSTGQNRRIEAIKIKPVNQMNATVHVKDIGNKTYNNITQNTIMGTVGEKKRLEAVKIESSDMVYAYQVHQKDLGWSNWCFNGGQAGTTGKSKQIEAMKLKVCNIAYQAHIQEDGWMSMVPDGITAGTTGQSKRVEAIRINPYKLVISAQAHIQDTGWVDYGTITKDTIIGTVNQKKRLECLKLKGNIEYRAHIQQTGWTTWTKADGVATVGTVGQSLRIEAIEIRAL